jgi:ribosomal protein S18 acetylase RimI-like enzyme
MLTILCPSVQVQSSNSLTFPRWYLENRKHISMLVHDKPEKTDMESRSEYPKQIQSGAPVAWAYAHDDLSLASLHVAEPYRRLGLGKNCVDYMAKKLIGAQKEALAKAGCGDIGALTPYLLDTEMHKGASRLFFEQQGFKGVVIATWGSILVTNAKNVRFPQINHDLEGSSA